MTICFPARALLAALLAFVAAAPARAAPAAERTVVVTAAALIDGVAATSRANVAVVIRGGRIVAVRDRDAPDLPADA